MIKPFGKSYSYTEAELDEMGEILLTAKQIEEDNRLHKLVKQHLDDKAGKINSLQDLKDMALEGNSDRKVL